MSTDASKAAAPAVAGVPAEAAKTSVKSPEKAAAPAAPAPVPPAARNAELLAKSAPAKSAPAKSTQDRPAQDKPAPAKAASRPAAVSKPPRPVAPVRPGRQARTRSPSASVATLATAAAPVAPAKSGAAVEVKIEKDHIVAAPAPAAPQPATARPAALKPPAPRATTAPKPASAPTERPASVHASAPRIPGRGPAEASLEGAAAAVGQVLPRALNDLATTGLSQARESYATFRDSAEALGAGFEKGSHAAARGLQDFSKTFLEAVQANADATLGFLRALTEVRSLSEVIEVQSRHARRQFETVSSQAKALAGIASRTASETAEPVREALDRSLKRSA